MQNLKKNSVISSLLVFFVFVFGLTGPITVLAATAPSLGDAASFSVLGAAAMSSANPTTISGDLGLSPGLAVSKTGTWTHTGGNDYFGTGGLSASAETAALGAYNNLVSQTTTGSWGTNPWSPVPGVWTDTSSPVFTGTITLNGDYSDVWVFKISTDFTFSGSVVLAGNAQACNVFWTVAGDATIGSGSHFVGTLIAQNDITSASGATINGRLISLSGTTIAMNGTASTISGPTCAVAPVVVSTPTGTKYNTLTVVKQIINDNGGIAKYPNFPLFVNGNPVTSGQSVALVDGVYTVTETNLPNYQATFSGDCNAAGQVNHGGINTHNDVCIITNNDIGAPVAVPPVPPLIDVVKVPSPLALPAGPGPVTYTYTLRNVGTVPVTDVTMVGDTCSPIVLASGDTNANTKLDLTETWVYSCSTTLSETHTNTVVAHGWANGISTADIASATVIVGTPVVPPLIHVTKVPSPLTLRSGGGMVTYTETVTNPGTVALSNVNLTDDKCSPVYFVAGDTNGDGKLGPTETWAYTCRTNLTQTTVNTATASGEANGLTVRDLAVATVTVAAVPALPNTGSFPDNNNTSRNLAILSFVLMLVSTSLVVVLRKKSI